MADQQLVEKNGYVDQAYDALNQGAPTLYNTLRSRKLKNRQVKRKRIKR